MSKLEKHLQKTTEEYTMIHVRSVNDVYVVNGRYAIVKDVTDTYRVISLVRQPYRELAGRTSPLGLTYSFDRAGRGADYKGTYNQYQLAKLVELHGSPIRGSALDKLQLDGAIVFDNGLGKRDLSGLPRYNNRHLDPEKGGWIIATVTPDGLLFGSKPKVHTDSGAAEAELQRLATVALGTEFVLMKAVKTAVSQTVQTKIFR